MNKTVRVRFAPSPTGHLHIGGLRTAIFNWLFARNNGGAFLLRIEDTDLERSKPEYTAAIFEALTWTSLTSDEPVVIQSENLPEHKKVLTRLLDEGKVYRCFCSVEEIEQIKEEQLHDKKLLKYPGTCRNRKSSADDASQPFVIRFKLPFDKGPITFNDLIRGSVTFDAEQLEDFIIARSDGTPMYNFVVVVDDAAMKITHVIRGEDHISNTPKQILLYAACGFDMPQFAHIPLILGPSGDRLSKRDGAVAVLDYRSQGYVPQALTNYLVRLGWAHGDQEVFTREELISYFSLEHVGKKASIFDKAKLDWMNGVYIRTMSASELCDQIVSYVDPQFMATVSQFSIEQLFALVDLYKDRAKTLKDIVDGIIYVHSPLLPQQELLLSITPDQVHALKEFIEELEGFNSFTSENLSEFAKSLCEKLKIKLPQLAVPLRIAVTGKSESPGIFHLLAILKKQESIRRLTNFVKVLEAIKKP